MSDDVKAQAEMLDRLGVKTMSLWTPDGLKQAHIARVKAEMERYGMTINNIRESMNNTNVVN